MTLKNQNVYLRTKFCQIWPLKTKILTNCNLEQPKTEIFALKTKILINIDPHKPKLWLKKTKMFTLEPNFDKFWPGTTQNGNVCLKTQHSDKYWLKKTQILTKKMALVLSHRIE